MFVFRMKIELFKSWGEKKRIGEQSFFFICFIINLIYHNCDFYVFFLLLNYDFIKNHTTAEYISGFLVSLPANRHKKQGKQFLFISTEMNIYD